MVRKLKLLLIGAYALLIQFMVCREIVFNPNPMADLNIFKLKNQNTYLSAISEDNQFAFVSAREGGVFVVSLANIILPTIVQNIPTIQSQFLYIKNDVLFVGDLLDGLLMYNISNPKNPTLISRWQVYLHIQAVVATQDLKYAFALGNGIVFCIDITDLNNPQTVSKNGVPSPNSFKLRLSPDETHLCVSNVFSGLQIIDIRQKQNMIIRVNQNPAYVTWDCLFTPDQTSIYSVDVYYGLFYANVKPVFALSEASTDQVQLRFIPIYSTPQGQISVVMTSDSLFLVLGHRSIGLVLFKIQDQNYQSPTFVQRINSEYLSNDVFFSKNNNEAYLFVTNGLSLQIFKQVKINTNKDFPNIFNSFQSSLIYLSPNYFPWQIICLSNNKHVIQTNGQYGINIFNIKDKYTPKLEASMPTINGDLKGIQVNQQLDTIYVGGMQDGLIIYNISDLSKVEVVKKLTPLNPAQVNNTVTGVSYNYQNNLIVIANAYYGFSVLNVTSSSQVQQIAIFVNKQFACAFVKCQITNDTTTIICACRETGLVFFDFNSLKLQVSYLLSKPGAEYLIFSQNEKYAFTSFGFNGLLIADIQNKYSPKILSVLPLDGWAMSLTPLYNELYLLVSQIEKGQLAVVNIQDLQNPYIQSKFQFPNENSNSVCVTPDQNSMYLIGNSGLRYIPINTSLVLHTQIQIQKVDEKGNIFYEDLGIGQSLQVGQTAQAFFVPLFIQTQMKVQKAFYYRNFQMQTLPFWITFYSETQNLQIQVDKTGAVNTFSNEMRGENIIVLQCLISLKANNFITSNINRTLSQQIYSSLINQGYLNIQGYLTSKLDPTITFYLNFFDNQNFTEASVGTPQQIQQIQNEIKQVLVFSLVQYPIRFYVESSLFFNYIDFQANSTNSIISTPSLQISVLIQIISSGKFVKKQLDGVIASFSDDLTSLQLQGQTQYGFSGQKTISSLFSSYRIRIVATDTYSTVFDEFSFKFTQIPFLYVVQLIVQIIGPILGVFGIWKYRSEIYTFFMERFYLFSDEYAIVGEVYKKQIILMNEVWQETEKLWKLFLSISKNFGSEIQKQYQKEKTINIQSVMNRLFQIYTDQQSKFPNIDPREFEFDDSRLTRVVKRFCYEFILKKDKNTQKILNRLKQIGSKTYKKKDWYKQFATINYNFEVSKNKVMQKSSKLDQKLNQNPLILCQLSSKLNQTDCQNISLDLKKEILCKSNDYDQINEQNSQTDINSIQNVLKYCSNFQTPKKLTTKEQIADFDSNGGLQNMLPKSNFLSQNVIKTPRLNQEDNLTDIKIENELNLNLQEDEENLNPFPEIIIKTDLIQVIVNAQFPNLNYDLQLLKEVMILEISGIKMNGPNRINPTTGEGLHLFSHQLLSVQAFKRDNEDSTCNCLKKFFKANYSPIGLNQNNPLPKWLNCQIINGIIHIWGTPKSNDEPELLIKIFDQLTFTILSYHLYIKDKEGIDIKDKRKSLSIQAKSSQNIKSKKLPQIQLSKSGSQISQQAIQDSLRENKIKGYLTSRLSRFSKKFSNSLRLQNNQLELTKNQIDQGQSDKEIDFFKQKKSDSITEQGNIIGREYCNSGPNVINQSVNRESTFKKDQFQNKQNTKSKITNQMEEDKNIDDEEEQARDYDEANGNQMSQQIVLSNYQARK